MGDELEKPFWFIIVNLIFVGKTKIPAVWVSLEPAILIPASNEFRFVF